MSKKAKDYEKQKSWFRVFKHRNQNEICKEWLDDIEVFMTDMGMRPTPKSRLSKIDKTGLYCKSNCKWSTTSDLSSYRRIYKNRSEKPIDDISGKIESIINGDYELSSKEVFLCIGFLGGNYELLARYLNISVAEMGKIESTTVMLTPHQQVILLLLVTAGKQLDFRLQGNKPDGYYDRRK